MDTNALKKFAQAARTLLIDQVTGKLAVVLDPASAARREHPEAMKALDGAIADQGKARVIEQVAYTWFNRFAALRFMDANGYTLPRVVSPADGAIRPEILAEAMAGNLPEKAAPTITALLESRVPSNDPRPIACCWFTRATPGTNPCRSCSRSSTIIPSCSCRTTCCRRPRSWPGYARC